MYKYVYVMSLYASILYKYIYSLFYSLTRKKGLDKKFRPPTLSRRNIINEKPGIKVHLMIISSYMLIDLH